MGLLYFRKPDYYSSDQVRLDFCTYGSDLILNFKLPIRPKSDLNLNGFNANMICELTY